MANSEKKQKNETDIFNNPPIKMPQLIKIEDTIPHLDLVENLLISVQGIEGLNNNFSALNGDILDSVYFEMGVYHGGILFPSSFVRSHTIDVRSSYLDKTYLEKLKFQSNAEKTDKYLSTIGSVDSRSEIPYLLKCSCNLISGIQIWRIPKVNIYSFFSMLILNNFTFFKKKGSKNLSYTFWAIKKRNYISNRMGSCQFS